MTKFTLEQRIMHAQMQAHLIMMDIDPCDTPEAKDLQVRLSEAWRNEAKRLHGLGLMAAANIELPIATATITRKITQDRLRKTLEKWAGPRCPDYEPECAVCQAWADYDKVCNSGE